jgi:hypothetical protein
MIRQCTADAFRQGRLFINTNENAVALLPNFDLLPRVADIYHQNMRDYHDDVRVMAAQRRLFADLVFTLYTFNRVAEAQRVMKQERQNLPVELAGADRNICVLAFIGKKWPSRM